MQHGWCSRESRLDAGRHWDGQAGHCRGRELSTSARGRPRSHQPAKSAPKLSVRKSAPLPLSGSAAPLAPAAWVAAGLQRSCECRCRASRGAFRNEAGVRGARALRVGDTTLRVWISCRASAGMIALLRGRLALAGAAQAALAAEWNGAVDQVPRAPFHEMQVLTQVAVSASRAGRGSAGRPCGAPQQNSRPPAPNVPPRQPPRTNTGRSMATRRRLTLPWQARLLEP